MAAEEDQLAALAQIHARFERERIDYWLFGGWAVDFHAGTVTRPHDDLDVAVWLADRDRVDAAFKEDGWNRADAGGEEMGYVVYRRGPVALEVAYLVRDPDGTVFTPAGGERGDWPPGSFGTDLAELNGVQACVVTLDSLKADKSTTHDDAAAAAKDKADSVTLARLSGR